MNAIVEKAVPDTRVRRVVVGAVLHQRGVRVWAGAVAGGARGAHGARLRPAHARRGALRRRLSALRRGGAEVLRIHRPNIHREYNA